MVQLLRQRYQGKLDARADEYITYAVEGAARMQALINDLLAFSRVGPRGQPLQPTDASTVLASVLANLAVAIRESQAVVTHDTLPTVMAAPTQITQLFQNLIGNGIKFRSERPPKIHVGAERVGDEWRFAVRDNGIGIEPQYFDRIFGVFQRLHSWAEYPGTGIGLAICKKVVDYHGGRIWVESQAGQGATFYCTLPERAL
jgi:light-regulated signal transduction histidine kinase (bacteriophytochrome)